MSAPESENGRAGRLLYLALSVGLFLLLVPLLALAGPRLSAPLFPLPLSAAQAIALFDILFILLLSGLHIRSAGRGERQ